MQWLHGVIKHHPLFIFYRRVTINGETYRDIGKPIWSGGHKTDEGMDAAAATGQNLSFFF